MTPTHQQATATRLLHRIREGDRAAFNDLFAVVYETMRQRAHRQRRRWHRDFTLNTTALVHEAYLKLVDQTQAEWRDRAHFLSVAAQAMRHLLIDYARRRTAQKRGGDQPALALDAVPSLDAAWYALSCTQPLSENHADALIALDEALLRLEQHNARQRQVVECRFFGGMTIEETAAALDLSTATVKRSWTVARAWLHREINRSHPPPNA